MSKAWSGGSTTAWRKLRAAILANNLATNHGQCVRQIPDVCTGQATEVHHVLGKAAGDDPRYLEPVCGPCNRHIGDPLKYEPQPKIRSRWA